MSAPSQFPAFLSIEYDGRGGGFPEFEKAAAQSFNKVDGVANRFKNSMDEVGRVVSKAISGGANSNGGIDLNVGQFRQAAAEARLYEGALRSVQQSATLLAKEVGDTSATTQSYLQALSASIIEARSATNAAEAQVSTYTRLQAALDVTAAKNSQLAESYRAVYAEAAKAAQQEVVARGTQQSINSVFAPGLTRSATANGAGFSALEDQLKREGVLIAQLNAGVSELEGRFARDALQQASAAAQAATAIAQQTEEINKLRSAEAAAANSANMLSSIYKNSPINNGAATANGAGFEALAADMQRAEQAAHQYEAALAQLRQQVDPAYFAQQRFDNEMAVAAEALKRGDISAAQYASRMAFLSAEMGRNATSTRATRFASVQLGQQLQDVVIQAQMGTNAFVILAQQGSQAAYALTGMGGVVGRVATAMAGWQGAIVLAGIAIVGQLIPALMNGKKASEEAEEAVKKHREAIEQLQAKMSEAVKSIEDKARADYIAAEADREAEMAIRRRTAAMLEQAKARLAIAQSDDSVQDDPTAKASAIAVYKTQISALESQVAANSRSLDAAEKAANRARGLYQSTIIDAQSTPEGRIRREYDRRRNAAIEQGGSSAQVAKSLADALRWRDEELKKIEATSKARQESNLQYGREIDMLQAKSIAKSAGFQVNSGTRTYNRQKELYDDWVNKGKPKGNPVAVPGTSAHETGRALDIQFGPNVSAASIRKAYADEGVKLTKILKEQGHFHIEWSTKGSDQVARESEKLAKEQQRIQEELDKATTDLISKYDEGAAAAFEYQAALEEINRLMNAGRISAADAGHFRLQADMGYAAKATKIQQSQSVGELLGDSVKPKMLSMDDIKAIGDENIRWASDVADYLHSGADAIEAAFGGKVGDLLRQIATASPDGGFAKLLGSVGKAQGDFERMAFKSIGDLFGKPQMQQLGKILGETLGAAGLGATAGSLVLGSSGSKTGSAIGGALGNVAGKALGKAVGPALGKLGGALGPLGSIAGGLLGGVIGGLFKKAKTGNVSIGGVNGNLAITSTSGNNAAAIKAVKSGATASISSIDQIAAALGANIDASKGSVTIGKRKDYYRVSGDAGVNASQKKVGNISNLIYDGQDEAEAVAAATRELIKDGVITGLRASTQRLIQQGTDLNAAVAKAIKFENVFRDLRRFKDPVGAAIDDLNVEFKNLIQTFKDAGASAEETAQLEELYGIKRKAAVEDALKSLTGSLKDLMENLTIGDSGYSLRTRLNNARDAYNPLAARVQAGDTTAYDDFAKAAQTLVDLQREYSGSQQDYFAVLDQVTALTKGELNRQQTAYSTATGAASPFDTKPLVTATETQTNTLVGVLNAQTKAANDNAAIIASYLQMLAARGSGGTAFSAGRLGF